MTDEKCKEYREALGVVDSGSKNFSSLSQRQRLHFLDSLRGIAALYVIGFHVLFVPSPHPVLHGWVSDQIVRFGGTGVFLFFVLSGFSLALTFPRHEASASPALSYGLSRFFRIAPLFYVMLLVATVVDRTIFHTHVGAKNFLASVLFLFNIPMNTPEGIVWASWTIGVEMLFYVAFIPLMRGGLKVQAVALVASILGFYVERLYLPASYTYWSVLGYMPMFIFGMWSYRLYGALQVRHSRHVGSILIAGSLLALLGCGVFPHAEKNVMLRIPIALGYSGLLIGCALLKPKFLETPALRTVGKVSYSTYLLHPMIVYFLAPVFNVIIMVLPDYSFVPCLAIVLAIVIPGALITYRFIERPFEKLGSQLAKRVSLSSAAQPAHSKIAC